MTAGHSKTGSRDSCTQTDKGQDASKPNTPAQSMTLPARLSSPSPVYIPDRLAGQCRTTRTCLSEPHANGVCLHFLAHIFSLLCIQHIHISSLYKDSAFTNFVKTLVFFWTFPAHLCCIDTKKESSLINWNQHLNQCSHRFCQALRRNSISSLWTRPTGNGSRCSNKNVSCTFKIKN